MELPTIVIPQYVTSTVAGAVGAFITLGCRFLVDRWTEKHKAEIGTSAKWKERYHVKQAEVVEEIHGRLVRCLEPTFHSYPQKEQHTQEDVDRITESTERACKAAADLGVYFRENAIYLPKDMAERVNTLYTRLGNMAVGGRVFPVYVGHTFPKEALENYREFETEVRGLFESLQVEFRDYLAGKVAKSS